MSDGFYAQDPTDLSLTQAFFAQQMDAAPKVHWAALIDSAFDHGHRSVLGRFGGIACYATQDLEGLFEVSPQLIPLHGESAHATLTRLLQHCSARPMLSVLASEVPLAELVREWHARYWAQTTDGQRLLLRFADTRVLPVLQTTLSPAQWAGLTAPLQQWFYIARTGKPASCALAPEGTVQVSDIELKPRQLDQLVEAAEPDTLLDYFAEHMPDVLPLDISQAEMHRRASLILELARLHGIESWGDKVALTLAEWQTDGVFRDDPRLVGLLQSGNWPRDGLGERLAEEDFI